MFTKRNFSIIRELAEVASPAKKIRPTIIQDSPPNSPIATTPVLKTSFLKTSIFDTPICIDPIPKTPTLNVPIQEIQSPEKPSSEPLVSNNEDLDKEIERRMADIEDIREKTIELQLRRLIFDDYLDIANKCQAEVRNSLNEIYNPGCELSKQIAMLIEEVRKNHSTKLEKLSFEMNQHLERASKIIARKTKEIEHSIKLAERTLMSLETQKQAREAKIEEEQDNVQSEVDNEDIDVETTEVEKEVTQNEEDDCVIIDDTEASCNASDGLKEQSAMTPDHQDNGIGLSNGTSNKSETTATCELEEDEETDIEESKEETERSFTPCQAQRPHAS